MTSGDVERLAGVFDEAVRVLSSPSCSTPDELRVLRCAANVIDALTTARMGLLVQTREHEVEGGSSVVTWGVQQLGQSRRRTRQMVQADRTLRVLPVLAEAFDAGRVSFDHVTAFTYALKAVGESEIVQAQGWLVEVAVACDPGEVFTVVKKLRHAVHPEALDQAWVDAMAKEDLTVAPTVGGWVIAGFLGPDLGAKVHAVLESLSIPSTADDTRTAAQRRLDGLDALVTGVLEGGLPTDGGHRPQLEVIVDATTLRAAAAHRPAPPGADPAELVGFGPIGPQLLTHLLCGADLTPILIDRIGRNPEVLDVGHTQRFATSRQRRAVNTRQHGLCATPGCRHTIGHHHHIQWVSRGGATNLDNLIGLCRTCHRLVHQGRITITGTHHGGYTFDQPGRYRAHPPRAA